MTLDAEVLEPEVIPPGASEPREAETPAPDGMHPVIAGLIIDLLRFVTIGPMGLVAGGAAGFLTARSSRASFASTLIITIASGLYCSLPPVGMIPAATLVAVIIVLTRKRGK